MRSWVLVVAFILLASPAWATIYYVSRSDGDDSFSGTEQTHTRGTLGPWRTIAKVNVSRFLPGDSILFKRGDVWRETLVVSSSGSTGTPITFGAYGIGPDPVLMSSLNKSLTVDWTADPAGQANLWIASGFSTDVGAIFVNGEMVLPVKVSTKAAAAVQGMFFSDSASGRVYLNSSSNPATFYSGGIECWYKGTPSSNGNIVYAASKSNLVFRDLELKFGGGHGFQAVDCDGVTVERLTVSFVGGSYLVGTTRYGNGIEFLDTATDILIQSNRVSQCFDEGISPQTTADGKTQQNITVRDNVIDKCGRGVAHSYTGTGGTVANVVYTGNVITDSGFGWAVPSVSNGQGIGAQLNTLALGNTISNCQFTGNFIRNTASGPDPNGQGILFHSGWSVTRNWIENTHNSAIRAYGGGNPVTIAYNVILDPNEEHGIFVTSLTGRVAIYNNTIYADDDLGAQLVQLGGAGYEVSNVTFKNNLLVQYGAVPAALIVKNSRGSTVLLDNNLYYRSTAGAVVNWNGTSYTQAGWAAYKSVSLQDARSPAAAAPQFTDVARRDFTLKEGSSAIDAGVEVGLTSDFAGTAVPQGPAPDIGAYRVASGESEARVDCEHGRPWGRSTHCATGRWVLRGRVLDGIWPRHGGHADRHTRTGRDVRRVGRRLWRIGPDLLLDYGSNQNSNRELRARGSTQAPSAWASGDPLSLSP